MNLEELEPSTDFELLGATVMDPYSIFILTTGALGTGPFPRFRFGRCRLSGGWDRFLDRMFEAWWYSQMV